MISPFTIGEVSSPNYPSDYPNNIRLTSIIQVEEGLIVALQFTAFDVEYHPSCIYDHLAIKDGNGATIVAITCGSSLPAAINSTSNMVKIYFETDESATKSGWNVKWSAVTPGDQEGKKEIS